MPRQPGEKPILRNRTSGWDQQWQWSDGTPLNGDEEREFQLKAAGDIGNIGQVAGGDYIGEKLGWNPKIIDSNAAGASLDTSANDAARLQTGELLASLQQQAATGDGSWQNSLAEATRRSQATAQAMGQSDPTASAGMAGYDIANAKGSAAQRAVGQGDRLRAQSKIDAQDQMGDILGQQAGADIAQSAEQARIERARRLANQASIDQTGKNREATEKGITGGITSMGGMSDGGRVPGRSEVFGDSEANDTVPAKLSPGEVVLPRSIAHDPQAAARFVAALNAGRGPQAALDGADGVRRFADGGDTGVNPGRATDIGDAGGYLGYFIEPHIGRTMQYDAMRNKYGAGGGGTLDTANFNQTRAQQAALNSMLAERAAGSGPTVTDSMLQSGTDGAIAAASQRHGAPLATTLGRAIAAQQTEGAGAAAERGNEQSHGERALGAALAQRRGQAMQMASAQQQAGWEKTLSDVGLSLDQQARLRGSISGAGQAASAFASMGKSSDNGITLKGGGGDPFGDSMMGDGSGEDSDEGGPVDGITGGGGDTEGDRMGLAFGGAIPSYAGGGKVSSQKALVAAIEQGRRAKPDKTARPALGAPVALEDYPFATERMTIGPDNEWMIDRSPQAPAGSFSADMAPRTVAAEPWTVRPLEHAPVTRPSLTVEQLLEATQRAAAISEADKTPEMLAAERKRRKRLEYEEETGEPGEQPAPGKKRSPAQPEPQRLATRGMAAGGSVGFGPPLQETGPVMADPRDVPMYEPVRYGSVGLPPQAAQAIAAQLEAEPAHGGHPALSMQAFAPGMMGGPPTTGPQNGNPLNPADYALRTTPGLALKQAPAADGQAPAAGLPVATKPPTAGGGIGMPHPEDRSDINALNESTIATQAGLEAQAARARAVGEGERMRVANEYAMQEKETRDRARHEVDGAFTRLQAAQDEMNRVDATVDPGRYWASRTTGQKVLSIIGLALGAAGTGPDGINRAAEMMNKAVDRDIEAQKAEYEGRLKKGAQRVASAQTYYGMAREAGLDSIAATHAAKAAALDAAASKTEMAVASIQEPLAKAKGQALIAAARGGAADKRDAAKQRTFENRIQLGTLEMQREAAGRKSGLPPDVQKVAAEVQEREQNIQKNARALDALIEQYGTQEKLAPGIEAQMNQLRSALIVDSAKMKDPGGVVREPDEEREGRALGFEPGFWQRSANARAAIKAFAAAAEGRKHEALRARGLAQ